MRKTSSATAWPARCCSAASELPAAKAAASSARIWATETIFTASPELLYAGLRGLLRRRRGRHRGLLRWRAAHRRPRAPLAVVRPYGIANLARVRALGLLDRLDHDVRRRQRTRLFGQATAERLHELVVDLLTAELAQQAAHLGDV